MFLETFNDIIVKELEDNDIEALTIFLMEVYQIDISKKEELYNYYYWKYIQSYNTFKFIKSLIAFQNEKVVGFLGLGNYELKIRCNIEKACWAMDWMTLKSEQTKGLGTYLLKLAINNKEKVQVTATELSPKAEIIFSKLGFIKTEVGKTITLFSLKSILKFNKRKILNILTQKVKSYFSINNFKISEPFKIENSSLNELVYNSEFDGNNRNEKFSNWLLDSKEFKGEILKINKKNNYLGYCIYNKFTKNNLKIVRIFDANISSENLYKLLKTIRNKNNIDILEMKISNNQVKMIKNCGFYYSPTYFWALENIKINPNNFLSSFADKDASYRGVNNIK